MQVPKSHPRYRSLMTREKLVEGFRGGLVVPQGLIAQGRAEAFDYLLGERTIAPALQAEKVVAAYLALARRPVISVNGNVAALAPREVVKLAGAIQARIEVNLFYRTEERVRRVAAHLGMAGARGVLGTRPHARIPGLKSRRALCSREGIYSADVILVPLEDGDRTQALVKMGKTVLAIDLNPLSRTSQDATVAVVDEITRALLNITKFVGRMKENADAAERAIHSYDRAANLRAVCAHLVKRFR